MESNEDCYIGSQADNLSSTGFLEKFHGGLESHWLAKVGDPRVSPLYGQERDVINGVGMEFFSRK
jgi:hypothetical protein